MGSLSKGKIAHARLTNCKAGLMGSMAKEKERSDISVCVGSTAYQIDCLLRSSAKISIRYRTETRFVNNFEYYSISVLVIRMTCSIFSVFKWLSQPAILSTPVPKTCKLDGIWLRQHIVSISLNQRRRFLFTKLE